MSHRSTRVFIFLLPFIDALGCVAAQPNSPDRHVDYAVSSPDAAASDAGVSGSDLAASRLSFQRDIHGIFITNCVRCHQDAMPAAPLPHFDRPDSRELLLNRTSFCRVADGSLEQAPCRETRLDSRA